MEKKVKLTITLPEELITFVDKIAKKKKVSRSKMSFSSAPPHPRLVLAGCLDKERQAYQEIVMPL